MGSAGTLLYQHSGVQCPNHVRTHGWGGGTEDESMLAIPINPHWTAVHPVNVEGLPGMVYIKTAAHSTTKYEVGRVRVRASANPMTVVRTAISSPK